MDGLKRYLREDYIVLPLQSRGKAAAIRELASLLEDGPEIPDFRAFLSHLFQKEQRFNSRVGDGVALPHYRDETVRTPAVLLGISPEGIDWGMDEPVHVLVLIVWPYRHEDVYLKVVAELAQALRKEDIRRQLLDAHDKWEVVDILEGETKQKAFASERSR